jgi:diadenosine tetraphosphate (Ap4A) HIT family hydrolase
MTGFSLHPQLEADTHRIGDLDFTRVLLMDDARFPWLILVPRAPDLRELTDLSLDDQHRLLDEINRVARVLHAMVTPDKLNIAMLGNMVPQLHVHVIARFTTDDAWPKPVWGIGARIAYDVDGRRERIEALRTALQPVA